MNTEIMAYATTGREFEVMADLAALGVAHWPGRRIEFERRGKSRVAEPFEYPALPNYLRISAPWHMMSAIMDIRHLSRTFKFLHPREALDWQKFQGRSDAKFAEAKRIIAERDRLSAAKANRQEIINVIAQYKSGDPLEIADGPFAGMLATFGRMVVKPGTSFPMVQATVQIFGRDNDIAVDPLSVRRAV